MHSIRACFFVILIFAVILLPVHGQGALDEGDGPPIPDTKATQELQKISPDVTAAKGVRGFQPASDGKTGSFSHADEIAKKDGTQLQNLQDATVNEKGDVTQAKHVESNGAKADGVSDFQAKPDDTITASKADEISNDNIALQKGEGIKLSPESVSVASADSLTIDDLLATKVKDAIFVKDPEGVSIKSKSGSSFKIKDSLGNEYVYKSLTPENLVRFSKDKTILGKNAAIELTKSIPSIGTFTEHVNSTGTTILQMNKDGIVCSDSAGEGLLAITFPDMNKDFAFNSWTKHKTCFRKQPTQSFPDCQNACVLVDYVEKKITINGVVDYLRHYQDDTSGWLYRTFASLDTNTKAILQFDTTFNTITNLKLNCTSCETHPNNYLTIYELELNNATHRFVHINPEVIPSQSILNTYETNSNATMKLTNNELVYAQDNTIITILPADSVRIQELLQQMNKKLPKFLFLPFLSILSLWFLPRRAQLSAFIVLGIIIAVVLFFVLLLTSPTAITKHASTPDRSLESCAYDAANDAVIAFTRQGSQTPLVAPYFTHLNTSLLTHVPSDEEAQFRLQKTAQLSLHSCLASLDLNQCSTAQFTTLLQKESTQFALDQCITEGPKDSSKKLETQPVEIPVSIKRMLNNARVIVESNVIKDDNQLIDLDQLRGTLFLFPYKTKLVSMEIQKDYAFVFAKAK